MIDKASLNGKLRTAFEDFSRAIETHDNINKKRADGGWTVGEIADHIVKSTSVAFGRTKKSNRPYDQHAGAIRDLFLDFGTKFPSDPSLHPKSGKYSKTILFRLLEENRKNIFAMIDHDDLTELCVDLELPVWGTLTKYEWLILIQNHIIRHTKQVNDFNSVSVRRNN